MTIKKRLFWSNIFMILLDLMLPGMEGFQVCRKLREKLENDPANPRYIETVWGAGYRFRG